MGCVFFHFSCAVQPASGPSQTPTTLQLPCATIAPAPPPPVRPSHPTFRYAANLAAIVRAALAAGAGRVFVLTPPPVDEVACAAHAASTWGAPPGTPPSRTDENAAAYAATALRVAAAEEDPRVVGVDVRSAFLAHPGGWRALLSDGLHLTAGGNGVVHAALAAAVVTAAPELAPESLARAAGGGGVEGRVVPGSHAPPPPLPPPAPPLPPLPVGCRPRVVLLGDEVAEAACKPGGWIARLADAYARTADVVLRGGEGIDSRWAVGLAGDALRCGGGGDGGSLDTRSPLAAAVLLFGGGAAPSRPLLPPLEHASNLCTLAAAALGAGARAVVITTPMPDSAERAVPHAAAARDAVTACGDARVLLADVHSAFLVGGGGRRGEGGVGPPGDGARGRVGSTWVGSGVQVSPPKLLPDAPPLSPDHSPLEQNPADIRRWPDVRRPRSVARGDPGGARLRCAGGGTRGPGGGRAGLDQVGGGGGVRA